MDPVYGDLRREYDAVLAGWIIFRARPEACYLAALGLQNMRLMPAGWLSGAKRPAWGWQACCSLLSSVARQPTSHLILPCWNGSKTSSAVHP
jgi:hypothetical protein